MPVETWQQQARPFYGWRLVVALAALDFINIGFPVTGGAVINTYMLRQIPMSRATYGLGFTLFNLFVAMNSTAVAAVIVKRGIRATLVVGSCLLAGGALSLSFLASKPWQYLVFFGIVMGTGVSFGSVVPITTAVTRWFRRYRGRAMSVALSASSLGGFCVAPAINKILVMNRGEWRQTWQLVAGIAVLAAIVAIVFVKERPEDIGQVVDGLLENPELLRQSQPHSHSTDDLWTSRAAYSTTSYWMIVVGGIACFFPFFFILAHWILRMRISGFTAAEAAWAMALFSAAGIAGRLIGGWIVDKVVGRYACAAGLCFYVAASLLALRIEQSGLLAAFAASVCFGIGFGWTFISICTMTAQYYGAPIFPKLNGMMLLLTGSIGAPAGLVGGKLFDWYHSYTIVFELMIVLALVGMAALIAARPPRLPINTLDPADKTRFGLIQDSIETGFAGPSPYLADAGQAPRKEANLAGSD